MLTIGISGAAETIVRLQRISKSVLAELKEEIDKQTTMVLQVAKRKASGEVLRNRTGTLRRKLNMRVETTADSVLGSVGVKLSYAAAHEFGSHAMGTCQVVAHLRRTKAQKLADTARGWKKKKSAGEAQVRAHTRNWRQNLPERSFLRSALDERRADIAAGIAAAVQRGTKK